MALTPDPTPPAEASPASRQQLELSPDTASAHELSPPDRHHLVAAQHALPDQAPARGIGVAMFAAVLTAMLTTVVAHLSGLGQPRAMLRSERPAMTWTGSPRQHLPHPRRHHTGDL